MAGHHGQEVSSSHISRGFDVSPPATSLSQLQTGERARVLTVQGEDAVAIRLLELGVLPGEVVEVLGFAPWGDPMAVRVRGARLALRRRDAARIELTAVESPTQPAATAVRSPAVQP